MSGRDSKGIGKRFVKSGDTATPVANSQRAIELILRRYGAVDFNFGSNWEQQQARISFRVPDSPDSPQLVPIRLDVSFKAVAERLGYYAKGKSPTEVGWAQAERVAWRHLVLWVDAACAAAGAGLQTMSEAFLAHTLVTAPDGAVKKVSVLLDEVAGEGGYRALLPAST